MSINVHFAGNALSVADSKGRFVFPLALRNKIKAASNNESRFHLGMDEDSPILRGFGALQWQDLVEEMLRDEANAVQRNIPFDRKAEQRRRFGTIEDVTFDEGGRFFLPDALRDYAGISDKIMFVGAFNAIELWQPERLLASEDINPGLRIACQRALDDWAANPKNAKRGDA